MDKRKHKRTLVEDNLLAVVKSAAWAWYQHGSDPNSSPAREFGVRRTKFEPKPSRYKQEAMRNVQHDASSSQITLRSSSSKSNSRASSSLLDEYEVGRILRQLDYYIGSETRNRVKPVQKKEKIKEPKQLRLRSYSKLCGTSRDDVVEVASFEHSRRPAAARGSVAVVKVSSCRPRLPRIRAGGGLI